MEDEWEKVKGVTATQVGYTGGTTKNPSYEQVCSGTTGHAEAVKLTFDPHVISYKGLAKRFLEKNSSIFLIFTSRGQYRTALFYQNAEEKKEAQEAIAEIEKQTGKKVQDSLEATDHFWPAEEYHQHYYKKNKARACGLF